jgi:NADPH:quinone reductase-like Zn-dependent oxidoreductase
MLFGSSLGSPIDGNLCEFAVFNERDAVHIPSNLSFIEASTLPCAGVTAWHALMEVGRPLKAGDTVLTLGTGGVSMMALQLARNAGATVISTSSSDEKLERVKALGATHTINYKTHPEWHEQVMNLTGGKGVDCVVEVGGAGTLSRSMQSIAYSGKIGMIGVLSGFEGDTNPHPVMFKGGSMHGIFVGNRAMFESLNRAIEVNDLHPVIDRVFSFDEAPLAYSWMQGQSHFGKIVISLT